MSATTFQAVSGGECAYVPKLKTHFHSSWDFPFNELRLRQVILTSYAINNESCNIPVIPSLFRLARPAIDLPRNGGLMHLERLRTRQRKRELNVQY